MWILATLIRIPAALIIWSVFWEFLLVLVFCFVWVFCLFFVFPRTDRIPSVMVASAVQISQGHIYNPDSLSLSINLSHGDM